MEPRLFASIQSKASERTPIFIGQGAVTEGAFIACLLKEHSHSRHILISDRQVYKLHGERLESSLRVAGLTLTVCLVPPEEASKSAEVYLQLVDDILSAGIDKGSYILTLGGGMVNNLGGFLAATLYRGIKLIHLPSSLMAQLDASIDLKQAINHRLGKNLIGCFYSPCAIIVDPQLLNTLPLKHLRSGLAEAVKHSLTQSPAFFTFLVNQAKQIRDPAFLEKVVREAIRLKLSLLHTNNFSRHGEFLLQYGHCIGHALESTTRYALSHGEAIAIGMAISADIAFAMRLCKTDLIEAHHLILSKYRLPISLPQSISIPDVIKAISYDKNIHRNTPRLTLLRDVGRVYKSPEGSFLYIDQAMIEDSLLRSRVPVKVRRG